MVDGRIDIKKDELWEFYEPVQRKCAICDCDTPAPPNTPWEFRPTGWRGRGKYQCWTYCENCWKELDHDMRERAEELQPLTRLLINRIKEVERLKKQQDELLEHNQQLTEQLAKLRKGRKMSDRRKFFQIRAYVKTHQLAHKNNTNKLIKDLLKQFPGVTFSIVSENHVKTGRREHQPGRALHIEYESGAVDRVVLL